MDGASTSPRIVVPVWPERGFRPASTATRPSTMPTAFGELAGSSGPLEALVVDGYPNLNTSTGWPVPLGEPLPVGWVDHPESRSGGRAERTAKRRPGAGSGARGCALRADGGLLARQEAIRAPQAEAHLLRLHDRRSLEDGTDLGARPVRHGAPFDLSVRGRPRRSSSRTTSPSAPTGDLFVCEDTGGDPVPHVRVLTPDGRIFDFARAGRGGLSAGVNGTEFCGVCFARGSRRNKLRSVTLFVNQQGEAPETGAPAVTYAIWGPWKRHREGGG